MNLDQTDLVRAIDAERHARRKAPPLPAQRHRTRHTLARRLQRLADRLDG